jgi:tetratricopeptide (TPR) repeat protein
MQHIQSNDESWQEIISSLSRQESLIGTYVVQGPSHSLSDDIQDILRAFAQRGDKNAVQYFLCSGHGDFASPCYEPFFSVLSQREPLYAFDVIDYAGIAAPETKDIYRPQDAVHALEHMWQPTWQLILIECITVPSKPDLLFLQALLQSALPRRLLILIAVHQNDAIEEAGPAIDVDQRQKLLLMLYVCGGRVREAELRQRGAPYLSLIHQMGSEIIHTRDVGLLTWFVFRNSQIARQAAELFGSLSRTSQQALACELLAMLPPGTGYPLWSLACYLTDSDMLASVYTPRTLKVALIRPRNVLGFFRTLRRTARKHEDRHFVESITVNYISALLIVYITKHKRLYEALCARNIAFVDKRVEARLFFTLGQLLAQPQDQSSWEKAWNCFQRTRASLCALNDIEESELYARLAAVANGEALILLKQGNYTVAQQLEETALAKLEKVAPSIDIVMQRALLQMHIGDLQRKSESIEAALLSYTRAHDLTLTYPFMKISVPIASRLADIFLKIHREKEALPLLEEIWLHFQHEHRIGKDIKTDVEFKTLLILAQTYISMGKKRSAARCYWYLLRRYGNLKPAVVKGIIANLQKCRPGLSTLLLKRLAHIITSLEIATRDAAFVDNIFDTPAI